VRPSPFFQVSLIRPNRLRCGHYTRGALANQLDDGIGDTLVLGSHGILPALTANQAPTAAGSDRGGLSNWIRSVELASARTRQAHRRHVQNPQVHLVDGREFGLDTTADEIAQIVGTFVGGAAIGSLIPPVVVAQRFQS